MVLFSPKMRRFLDEAVSRLADRAQRDRWHRWALSHPQTRGPTGPIDDGGDPVPFEIARIASIALSAMEDRLTAQKKSGVVHDDDEFELDNDLSMIMAVRRLLDEDQKVWQKT